jgi:hypothetical protein
LIAPDAREAAASASSRWAGGSKSAGKGGERTGIASQKSDVADRLAAGLAPRGATPAAHDTTLPTVHQGGDKRSKGGDKAGKDRSERGRIWIVDDHFVRPVDVRIGLSDGTSTEITGRDVKEDMEVALGEARNEPADGGDTNNPFAPKLFRRTGGAPKGPQ